MKLMTSINNMYLLFNFTQSDLNFEPSFVEIHQVLREIWLFGHDFQTRNFSQLRIWEREVSNDFSTNCV